MASSRPPSGSMVHWRVKGEVEYRFGYCTYVSGPNLIRLGTYNGDTTGGKVVSAFDIEWTPYR